jgi:uridine kinase
MRAAIIISGYLRVYSDVLNFINNNIKPYTSECDVFLHITKNENEEDKYYNIIDEEKDIKKIISDLNPKSVLIEPNVNYSDDQNINGLINQWSKLKRLNDIKKSFEITSNKKYDLVFRMRPDLSINTANIFNFLTNEQSLYIPKESKIDTKRLYNKNDGHLCDAFAFGPSEIMDIYFDLFNSLNEYIDKYGSVSETLLYYYTKNQNLKVNLLDIDYGFKLSKCNIFAICGDSGSGKSTLSKYLKDSYIDSFTLECDRYHKWERGDENWSNYTHLNPNANFIQKMKEDVFNLKVGKEIYQVDYDHSTGKFTEKQQIDPSNNLIVCGLHTIYDENINSLYDVKIFMDPQKELKYKWKIIRDVKERGYDIKKVLESIKKRESDYKNFILPQKENADIVVNFFSKNKIDINDIEQEIDLGLRLIIKSKFKIEEIKNQLDLMSIKYEFFDDGVNCTFIFNEYVPLPNLRYGKNNFYDYIFLFIFNL